MRAYYALVDDILKWDEFEEAVCSLNSNPDDEDSEKSAAAEVVQRCGRLHPKISKLSPKPTLNSFFCQVIEKEPLKEFMRADKSPGLVTRILVGDDTGEAVLVFWDEKAYAVEEINSGDILEVAGRFKNLSNIIVVDLRRGDEVISLREKGIKTLKPCSFKALILNIGKSAEYKRKDETSAFKTNVLAYGENGFLKITVWNQKNLERISSGMTVKISGVVPKPSPFKEYTAGDDSSFEMSDDVIRPPLKQISDVKSGEFCNVRGVLDDAGPVLGYFRDDETTLWLKKGIISDDTGKMPFVLWGEHAKKPLFEGDLVTLYNCLIKTTTSGSILCGYEIHAGYNSCIMTPDDMSEGESEYFSAEGIVTDLPDGIFLINENCRYLLKGGDLRFGEETEVSGILKGNVIAVESQKPVHHDYQSLSERLDSLEKNFKMKTDFS